jgi:hypothetical protein
MLNICEMSSCVVATIPSFTRVWVYKKVLVASAEALTVLARVML